MVTGKHGGALQSGKHGTARGRQRSCCNACRRHFVEGDKRVRASLGIKKAQAVTLYSLG